MPDHRYIFVPSRESRPVSSVNSKLAKVDCGDGTTMRASEFLDKHRAVVQMTWAPGEPMLIADRLVSDGGWIERRGCNVFNLYREPTVALGDPNRAGPWIDHINLVYPDEGPHIIRWLAHRVQKPGEKINHALVRGGGPGIGKDTLLEPVKYAVGPWNFGGSLAGTFVGAFQFVREVRDPANQRGTRSW